MDIVPVDLSDKFSLTSPTQLVLFPEDILILFLNFMLVFFQIPLLIDNTSPHKIDKGNLLAITALLRPHYWYIIRIQSHKIKPHLIVLELKFKNHVVDLPVHQSTYFFEFSIFFLESYRQKTTHFWPILPEKFIFQFLPNSSAGKYGI